jgi:hypothetical protein
MARAMVAREEAEERNRREIPQIEDLLYDAGDDPTLYDNYEEEEEQEQEQGTEAQENEQDRPAAEPAREEEEQLHEAELASLVDHTLDRVAGEIDTAIAQTGEVELPLLAVLRILEDRAQIIRKATEIMPADIRDKSNLVDLFRYTRYRRVDWVGAIGRIDALLRECEVDLESVFPQSEWEDWM